MFKKPKPDLELPLKFESVLRNQDKNQSAFSVEYYPSHNVCGPEVFIEEQPVLSPNQEHNQSITSVYVEFCSKA